MADAKVEFNEELMPAEQPASMSEIVLDQRHMEYAAKRWPDASIKQRENFVRKSIWVRFEHRKPHPDDPGRRALGGPQPNSGRRPRKALGTAIVEHFEGRTTEILNAIAAPLSKDSNATDMERHKAGMNIAKHAREEEREKREADDYARKTDDEVRREFAAHLANMVRTGELSVEDIFEGSATEIVDETRQLAS